MRTLLNASARGFLALALAASAVAFARADSDDRRARDSRVISARAGGVNFVAGDVAVRGAGEIEWRRLTTDDQLKSGDAVRTGADGRAEILLNPGSYLRLAENSEFWMTDASLAGLWLRLARGSAIVEAMSYGTDLSFVVSTPHARATVVRGGVYRFNAAGADASEIVVQKGLALLGENRSTPLKEGRAARFTGAGAIEIVKWDKKTRDAFDLWSRGRAEELARANRKLQTRSVNTLLARANFDDLFGTGGYPLSGFWLFNGGYNCYTFVPFFYGGGSPYGYFYDARFSLANCRACRRHPGFALLERRNAELNTGIVVHPAPTASMRAGYGANNSLIQLAPVDAKHPSAGGGGSAAVGAKSASPKN